MQSRMGHGTMRQEERVEGIQMDIERMAEASNGRAVCNAREQG